MKRTMLFIAVLLLAVGLYPQVAVGQTETGAAVFAAVRYDKIDGVEKGKAILSFGVAKRIAGPLWAFPSFDLSSEQKSANAEVGAIFTLGTRSWFAIVGGPNVDWQNIAEQSLADQIAAYISGGAGFLVGYNMTDKLGLSGMSKYNFKLDEETQTLFRSGWAASVALHYFLE